MSLPYPEPGIRLIRQQKIDAVRRHRCGSSRRNWPRPCKPSTASYYELKAIGPAAAGQLVQPRRLSRTRSTACSRSASTFRRWSRRSIFSTSTRRLYEEQCQRVQSRFDEAVRLAEEAFTAELAKLLSHLTERLSGQEDGKPKIFQGLGRREPHRVLPAVPRVERPLQRAARPARRPMPSGSSAASIPRTCATTPACGSTSPRKCRGCRACWTACWSIGRDGTFCVGPNRGIAMQIIIEPGGAVRCIYARRDRPCRTGQPRHLPCLPRRARPARTLAGRHVARGWRRCWGRFDIRSEALAAEHAWLETNWLPDRPQPGLFHHQAGKEGP